MSVPSHNESKKWIQVSVAAVSILLGYILINFFEKLAEWFVLETTIPHYFAVTQVLSVIISIGVFSYILKNAKSSEFLNHVFDEIMKVVWPNGQQTWRHTFVILVAVTIFGFVFGFFDFAANYLLGLVNK